MSVNSDNLPRQIEAAMDAIRAEVWYDDTVQPHWRGRLVDRQTLTAELTRVANMTQEFEQVSWPRRIGLALGEMKLWQAELQFQRLWLDAASWARCHCHVPLEKRLGRVYRLFYGDVPILSDDWAFVPSGRTVNAVANQIRRIAYKHPHINEPKLLDYVESAGANLAIIQNDEPYGAIEAALQNHDRPSGHLLRLLEFAFEAVLFSRRAYELDMHWSCSIFGVLDAPNLNLAAALNRLHGHYYGWVFGVNGERLDRPRLGSGHVPENPTETQVKEALFDANPLRAEWVKRLEQQEQTEAHSSSVEDEHDGQLSHELD